MVDRAVEGLTPRIESHFMYADRMVGACGRSLLSSGNPEAFWRAVFLLRCWSEHKDPFQFKTGECQLLPSKSPNRNRLMRFTKVVYRIPSARAAWALFPPASLKASSIFRLTLSSTSRGK